MRRLSRLAITTFGVLGLARASADEPARPDLAAIMRAKVGEIVVTAADGATPIERVDEPIYRFEDPAREFSDGTTWLFGKTGRPAALVTFSLEKVKDGRLQWVEELTAISPGKFVARLDTPAGRRTWAPTELELPAKPIAPASAPAEDAGKRLRQMKEIARRFRANEFWSGPEQADHARGERYELRLLPQPVHRYSDPDSGILDGAVFLFSYGSNPEIALVMEARREGAGESSWSYSLARIAGARLHVRLDDREIADWEPVQGAFAAIPYQALAIPAPELRR